VQFTQYHPGRRPQAPYLTGDEVPVLDPAEACRTALDAGLVVRRDHPLNCETALPALARGAMMPSARFYVRNHFGIPDLDPATWRLRVTGLVKRRLSLGLAELRAMPAATAVVTLECAGNGRAGFQPPVPGEHWELGAVSTAEWTGVPLTEVLGLAGVPAAAREVVFRGADSGQVAGRDGQVHFERSLAADQLGQAGALLAYAMNGEELPARHGYPLRLVVPGWYAVASVKWLTGIELAGRPFDGHFQVDRYHIDGEPVSLQRVRSLIVEPAPGGTVEPGDLVIRGVAWSGAAAIASVEVRIDDASWQPATLAGGHHDHGWVWWELHARLSGPGDVVIRARATDVAGRTQPARPRWNLLGYANNAIHEVRVTVAPGEWSRPLRRSRLTGGSATMHSVSAGVAQQAEQPSCKRQASGSNPLTGSQFRGYFGLIRSRVVDRFVDRMSLIRSILLVCRESPKVVRG
jgi:DMSO/TMAO reductase YedYZ molybdopterin-dependent catalytic subunit